MLFWRLETPHFSTLAYRLWRTRSYFWGTWQHCHLDLYSGLEDIIQTYLNQFSEWQGTAYLLPPLPLLTFAERTTACPSDKEEIQEQHQIKTH